MKNFKAKYLAALMLATFGIGTLQASRDTRSMNDDNCGQGYECGCSPLRCGSWDLQVHGGVDPIHWGNRVPIFGVNCTQSSLNPLIIVFNATPNFNKFFKIPWIVGGQIGCHATDNIRVYAEFNYVQAQHKTNVTVNSDFLPAIPVTFNFTKYKLFDAYIGARYYWDRWCNRFSLFLGGKIGLTHHRRATSDLSFITPVPLTPTFSAVPFFNSNTIVSGGANVGLDYCICDNWSFVITGEVVASYGPRGAGNIPLLVPQQNFTSLIISEIRSELRFPITFAVRYSF